jgi:arylsulfatase A-like enzyme
MSKPNVVFIISDDTKPEWMSCYGGSTPTPTIDAIARDGVRFDQFTCSSPICQPSRYSYLTGRYAGTNPDDHFLEENPTNEPARVEFNVYINEEIFCQGRYFQAAGYNTGFAGKWHSGYDAAELGVPAIDPKADPDDPGTDALLRQRERILSDWICRTGGYDHAGGIVWMNNGARPIAALEDHHIEWSVQSALDFLDEQTKEQPFLLHYASTCVHGPDPTRTLDRDPRYTMGGKIESVCEALPPRASLRPRLEKLGLPVNQETVSMLWYDDQVGAIIRKLEEKGVRENTIIVICGDHGPEPAKSTCYERGIRVPCIVSDPARLPQGTVVASMAQNIDMMPTLLDLCGIEASNATFDGASLVPLLRGDVETAHEELFFEIGYQRALRTARYKYIALRYPSQVIDDIVTGSLDEAPDHMHNGRGSRQVHAQIALCSYPGYFDHDQLYDLQTDPYERINLAQDPAHAKLLEQMKTHLKGYLSQFQHPYPLKEQHEVLSSKSFHRLANARRAVGTSDIPWWSHEKVAFD